MDRDLPRASSNSSLSDSSDAGGPGNSADLAREMAETISSLQRLSRMEDSFELRPGQRRGDVTAAAEGAPHRARGTEPADGRLTGLTERRVETRVTLSSTSQSQRETTVRPQARISDGQSRQS